MADMLVQLRGIAGELIACAVAVRESEVPIGAAEAPLYRRLASGVSAAGRLTRAGAALA